MKDENKIERFQGWGVIGGIALIVVGFGCFDWRIGLICAGVFAVTGSIVGMINR